MSQLRVVSFAVLLILPAAVTVGGNAASVPRPQPWELEAQTVGQQLASRDAGQVTAAVEHIKQRIKRLEPGHPAADDSARTEFMRRFNVEWGEKLIQLKRYDDVEQIAVTSIIVSDAGTTTINAVQKLRVMAFHAAGKEQEALGAAKGYYNACSLQRTGDAVTLLAAALGRARPDDRDIGRRFRAQQIRGGEATGGGKEGRKEGEAAPPATQSDLGENVLAGVKVDGSMFEKAIAGNEGWEFKDMIAKANLLLLADRNKEARAVMRMAYELAATDGEMADTTEGVARAMRAEDGNVARANAWLMSLKNAK